MKKHFGAAIIAALSLMAATPVFAADPTTGTTGTIVVDQSAADHTYTAYQIFTGNIDSKNGDLSNIEWGAGINTSKFPKTAVSPFSEPFTATNAADIAKDLSGMTGEEALQAARVLNSYVGTAQGSTSTLSDGSYTISGLEPGYYLITDTLDKGFTDTAASAKIMTMVDGTKPVTVQPKEDVPTLTKAVQPNAASTYDLDNSTDTATLTWTNKADYSEGDVIEYKLEVTVPSSTKYYTSYIMSITDQIQEGLTPDLSSVKVLAEDESGQSINVTKYFDPTLEGNTLTLKDTNIKDIQLGGTPFYEQNNPTLVITYDCILNKNAVLSPESNDNTAHLKYSAVPTSPTSEGTTPDAKASVYTFEVDINKTDAQGNPLKGAGFTLYKEDAQGQYQKVDAIENLDGNTFDFQGLGSGNYKLEETTTPDGYNTMKPIEFTITANYTGSDKMHVLLNSVDFEGLHGTQTETGKMSVTIENKAGAVLPHTGSVGMAILLAGGVAIVTYGVVSKKRENRK